MTKKKGKNLELSFPLARGRTAGAPLLTRYQEPREKFLNRKGNVGTPGSSQRKGRNQRPLPGEDRSDLNNHRMGRGETEGKPNSGEE